MKRKPQIYTPTSTSAALTQLLVVLTLFLLQRDQINRFRIVVFINQLYCWDINAVLVPCSGKPVTFLASRTSTESFTRDYSGIGGSLSYFFVDQGRFYLSNSLVGSSDRSLYLWLYYLYGWFFLFFYHQCPAEQPQLWLMQCQPE